MRAKEDASFLVFKPEYSDIYYWLKQLQLLQPKHACLVMKTDSSAKFQFLVSNYNTCSKTKLSFVSISASSSWD